MSSRARQPSIPAQWTVEAVADIVERYRPSTLKHRFACSHHEILDAARGRPFGLCLHSNEGTEGAERAAASITAGPGWAKPADYVVVSGQPSKDAPQSWCELDAMLAAQLMEK